MEEHATTALLGREELAEHSAHDGQPTSRPDTQATKEAAVPPLDYAQLRLLAECAVGMQATDHTDFFFTDPVDRAEAGGGLRRQPEDRALTNVDVVIPVSNPETKFPANQVTVSVFGGDLAASGSQPLMGLADAMFWSDAAVQKFVVPYLASCSGSGAVQTLEMLQQAWNFYPANDVAVYALAHVAAFEPGVELSLAKAFQVGFVEVADASGNPPLQWMPLDDFTATHRPVNSVPDAPKEPVPYHRGKSHLTPQNPDYRMLRAMAEYACSIRGPARYFLLRQDHGDPERHGFVGPFKDLPRVGFGDIVIPVRTPAVPSGRGEPHAVWFQPPVDVEPANLAEIKRNMDLPEHDAVFWSTGAIEQFLFPYYASKCGFEALVDLARMYYVWTGKMPPQWRPALTEQASCATWTESWQDLLPSGDEVYGLVHLYTSEWVADTGTAGTAGSGEAGSEDAATAEAKALKGRLEVGREIGIVHRDPTNPRKLEPKALFRLPGWNLDR